MSAFATAVQSQMWFFRSFLVRSIQSSFLSKYIPKSAELTNNIKSMAVTQANIISCERFRNEDIMVASKKAMANVPKTTVDLYMYFIALSFLLAIVLPLAYIQDRAFPCYILAWRST